jgi:hypothetical protein
MSIYQPRGESLLESIKTTLGEKIAVSQHQGNGYTPTKHPMTAEKKEAFRFIAILRWM